MTNKTIIFVILLLTISLLATGYEKISSNGEEITFPKKVIQINDKKITVEIANTEPRRQRGLMFRKSLPKNQGMLFVFDRSTYLSFWMKNTSIPLDIGFFNKDRELTEIKSMTPHSTIPVDSTYRSKYALEVNRGWFKENNITIGKKFIVEK